MSTIRTLLALPMVLAPILLAKKPLLGLDEMDRPAEPRTPYVLCTVDLGERLVPNLDSVAEALAHGEGEAFR